MVPFLHVLSVFRRDRKTDTLASLAEGAILLCANVFKYCDRHSELLQREDIAIKNKENRHVI